MTYWFRPQEQPPLSGRLSDISADAATEGLMGRFFAKSKTKKPKTIFDLVWIDMSGLSWVDEEFVVLGNFR